MKLTLLLHLALTAFVSTAAAQKLAASILLWPGGAPAATGISDEDKPAIIPFDPAPSKRNGAAVLVVPAAALPSVQWIMRDYW